MPQSERILIVAPVGRDASAMKSLLEGQGFRAEVCADLVQCCGNISSAGALLITEEALELPQVSDLLNALKAQPTWSELPLIILTSGGESRLVKLLELAANAAGNVTLLERPMSTATLLRSIQVAISSRRRQYQVRDLLLQEQVLRREAENANRAKDEFLATVSHELRNPLNAILGWATMLNRGDVDPAVVGRAIGAIERNARTQAQLIEDLLDVSRAISNKLQLDLKPLQLESVIESTVESIKPGFEAKGVLLDLHLEPEPVRILGDEIRLQQVLGNLLSNALKFTHHGGRVQVRLGTKESQAQISVIDTGVGIPRDFLPHVFEPFKQAERTMSKSHGGLGLGLAIVKRLVELHGGTVAVASEGKGLGATFTVSLPLAPTRQNEVLAAHDGPTIPASTTKAGQNELPSLSGLRVLAVDDEDDSREMIKEVLEQSGASVLTAGSTEEALKAFPNWKPDVLVSDIGMPREDGLVLIRKVRLLEIQDAKNIPAIALTAFARVEDRIRALDSGYQMFLPKPIEASELIFTIASLIGPIHPASSEEQTSQEVKTR
jgi:signal transduction histidine kinase/ActR/RegA family two-component response regulator